MHKHTSSTAGHISRISSHPIFHIVKYYQAISYSQGEVVEDYDASLFKKTKRTVSAVTQEKERQAKSAVKASKSASTRRNKSVQGRVEALQKLAPGFKLKTAASTPAKKGES